MPLRVLETLSLLQESPYFNSKHLEYYVLILVNVHLFENLTFLNVAILALYKVVHVSKASIGIAIIWSGNSNERLSYLYLNKNDNIHKSEA